MEFLLETADRGAAGLPHPLGAGPARRRFPQGARRRPDRRPFPPGPGHAAPAHRRRRSGRRTGGPGGGRHRTAAWRSPSAGRDA
ncbi:MAG: hypothetical protein M0C28_38495 [Candidatus Moduliflexus flocculans]|nr:hypothetical protein [Candidatus Moduliflexus flocculans]